MVFAEGFAPTLSIYGIFFRRKDRYANKNTFTPRRSSIVSCVYLGMSHRHTEATKKKLSEQKINFYKAHPEKHHWKRHDKFKSIPCEKLKAWMTSKDVVFISEYSIPDLTRSFSIDIAFPDKMVGIEINGNQHYNPDGSLKPYYQIRHNLIEAAGWKLYELHYSVCFHLDEFEALLPTIMNSPCKATFDYFNYKPKPKPKKIKPSILNPNWRKIPRPERRRVVRPSKDELQKLVWSIPSSILTKQLGLSSDTNIAKWCRAYNISKPPRGYWAKKRADLVALEGVAPT